MLKDTLYEFAKNLNLEIYTDELMAKHSSFKTGGKALAVIFPKTVDELRHILKVLQNQKIKFRVIGRGSNMLFSDEDMDVVFIKISNNFDFLEIEDGVITVGSGYSLQKLAKVSSKKGLSGLEFAGGIPGTIGGAIYMNAGAHTSEIKELVDEVVFLDEKFEMRKMSNKDCEFSYRKSIFQKKEYIILGAKLNMIEKDQAEVFKKMLGNLEYRKEMQPLDKPTFGSVFKNPQGGHAGKIIEEVGLKGKIIGSAMVSKKHANFIENLGGATTQEALDLIEYIKKEVKFKKNIDLIEEVEVFEGK